MHEFAVTVLAFALILGVLVFVHEMGHYLAARWSGVKVDTFSIGFGPVLYRWHDRTGTEWRLSAIPLGGFVKPHGFEDPEDATAEQKATWIPGQTFHDKPVGARMLVIVMGPVFNFMFAILLFTVIYMGVGKPELKNEIAQVVPQSAAERAGVLKGDVITRLGSLKVFNFADIQAHTVTMPGMQTTLGVRRNGRELSLPITVDRVPGKKGAPETGSLGIMAEVEPGKPMPAGRAMISAARETWAVSVQTLQAVGQILTGHRSARELGGTIRIAQLSGQVAHYGAASILSFMALLSINLGLVNLFPIPLLDGGRLVFYLAEAARGRPVSRRIQELSYRAGFAIIAALFLFSTFNDLSNIGLFH